jgi:hypothetical protein
VIVLNKTYFVDQAFPGVALKYEFYIDEIYFDKKAINIRYGIFTNFADHYQEIALVSWHGAARDNCGNRYNCTGGICNRFSDETHTEGNISFVPLLNLEINRLDFMIVSAGMDMIVQCEFTVDF